MKRIVLIPVCLAGIALAFGIWHWRQASMIAALSSSNMLGAGDNETYSHKLARYRAGADVSLRSECTNAVVGLRSVLKTQLFTNDDNFNKWTASATVEFINKVGGVDREELKFRFWPGYNGQPCWLQNKAGN